MLNFDELLRSQANMHPHELAFADEIHDVTFFQLNSFARKIANILMQLGVRQGDVVCTALPTYPGWVVTLSLHLLGVTTMSRGEGLLLSAGFSPDWLITFQPDQQFPMQKTVIFDEAFLRRINASDEIDVAPGYASSTSLARFFTTSGTTGERKFIAFSLDELDLWAKQPSSYPMVGEPNLFCLFPFGGALSYKTTLASLKNGNPALVWGHSNHRLSETFTKFPIRTIVGSPLQVSKFLELQRSIGYRFPELRTVILTGSPPSMKLLENLHLDAECKIFDGFGSTEAGNVTIREITDGISGGALINSSADVQIVDENDLVLPLMQTGRIRYKKPGMATSYYKNPVASAEFFKDGYFYPGDLGYIDEAGLLVLCGRVNEVINLGGVKINPEKVDEVALAQLGVLDCASFAVSDASGVEQLGIALVTDGDFDLELFTKAMASDCVAVPSVIKQVGAIARNDNGKVVRGDLSAQISTFKGDNPG